MIDLNSIKLRFLFFTLMICLGAINQVWSQGITLKAWVDSSHILIGDQVKLGFEVSQPKNVKVDFPQFLDTIVDKIEIVKAFDRDTTWISNQEFVVKQEYIVTSFDSGFHYIPPFDFPIKSEFNDDTLQSRPFFIEVFTLPVDTAKGPVDIKKPYETPLSVKEVLPYVTYGLLGLLISGIIIYIIVKRKRNEPVFQRVKPKLPPHIIALDELDRLKQERIWQQGRIKEYYSRLTEIIRTYIEGRFSINAMEYTTDETIEAFSKITGDKEMVNELNELLSLADFVKFAKHNPQPDENERCFQIGYNFVRKTKPIEQQVVSTGDTKKEEAEQVENRVEEIKQE